MRLEHRWSQRRMSEYVDGDMPPRERERLERHADLCPECGPLRRALFWLTIELRELRRQPERSIAPQVIEHIRAADPDHAQTETGS
jgi:anti-sigma factor RsiW